ncbi:MAG: hypothetical protein M3Z01_04835, partial [Thermoproteota archaeon]|nr:hypothetical protein [Thermoproteota archaeon]
MRIVKQHINIKIFLFLIFFFNGLGINSFNTTDASLVIMALIGFGFLVFVQQEKIDHIFFYILIYWLLINFFAWAFLGGKFAYSTFIGSILKLFIGYCFLKIFKELFISWFENMVFLLSLISIIFFAVQIVDPQIFYLIPFNLAESGRKLNGDWNGLIFNFSPNIHPLQNSGFAGEPGTFGYYIGLAMIFNIILNEGRLNKKLVVFVLVGLTTLSTNFYLTLMLFVIYFISQSTLSMKIISVFLLIPTFLLLFQLPFVGEKIEEFIKETKQINQITINKFNRINRLAIFFTNMQDVFKYPLGYGINKSHLQTNIYGNEITGTNDVARIAVRFGIFGFLYFIRIFFKLFKKISLNMRGHYIFTIIVLMYIAANSMERDYFAMGIFWLYFILKEKDIIN